MTSPDLSAAIAAYNERLALFQQHINTLPEDVYRREDAYLVAESARLEQWKAALAEQQQAPAPTPAAQPAEQMSTRAKIGLSGVGLIVGGFFISQFSSFGVVLAMIGILTLIWSWIAKAPRHRVSRGGSSGGSADAAAMQVAALRAEQERMSAIQQAEAQARAEADARRRDALARAADIQQQRQSGTW